MPCCARGRAQQKCPATPFFLTGVKVIDCRGHLSRADPVLVAGKPKAGMAASSPAQPRSTHCDASAALGCKGLSRLVHAPSECPYVRIATRHKWESATAGAGAAGVGSSSSPSATTPHSRACPSIRVVLVGRRILHAARRMLSVGCCMPHVVCCMLCVACSMPVVRVRRRRLVGHGRRLRATEYLLY